MAGEGTSDVLAAMEADPLLAPYAEGLRPLARSSVRLHVDRNAPRHTGESRVGGPPSAPPWFEWPTRRVEMPRPSEAWIASQYFPPRLLPADGISTFEFIAQVDLTEVAPFDVAGLLPRDGLLLFFYDEFYQSDITPTDELRGTSRTLFEGRPQFHVSEFGFDQIDQVRVMHVPGTDLIRHDAGPHPKYAQRLVPSQEWTLPSTDAYVVAPASAPADELVGRVVLPEEVRARYNDVQYDLRMNADICQMLGWEDNGAHGPSIAPEYARRWSQIPSADRLRESLDARLLLQLSPAVYEPTGIRFGRTLYFYVRESDLRRGDFSRAWYDSD